MHNLSREIKQLRLNSGLTQDLLAEQLHVTRQAVSNWENGKTRPDLDTLQAIAQICGGDLAALLGLPHKAEPDYITGQRKYWIAVAACGAILLIGIALHFTLLPRLQDMKITNWDMIPLLKYQIFVTPACYLALGWLIPTLLSLKLDLRPTQTVRILCTVSTVICLLICVIAICSLLISFSGVTLPFWSQIYPLFARHVSTVLFAVRKYIPFLFGLSAFFTWN